MVVITKKFGTYICFTKELKPFLEENSLFLKDIALSSKNNHVPGEKELKFPQQATMCPRSKGLSCLKEPKP
jgi:hypothetical protein